MRTESAFSIAVLGAALEGDRERVYPELLALERRDRNDYIARKAVLRARSGGSMHADMI